MSQALIDVLAKRRDRAIAVILKCKEREVDPLLLGPDGAEASAKLRRVVLDQIHDIHDLCLDLVGSLETDSGVVLNEHYLDLINEIHNSVVKLGDG